MTLEPPMADEAPPARPAELPLSPGAMVMNYRIVQLIGRGGMGLVFEAVHKDLGRRVAIKVLHPELAQHPQLITRFLNEARAVNLVRHPGLIEIFEFGLLEAGIPYFIMEHLDGELLSQRMRRHPGPLGQGTLRLARQIALALRAAHAKGIVHRDLKPDNVMIIPLPDQEGAEQVKILDFGVAKIQGQFPIDARFTVTGMTLGTPQYMSPEQCMGIAAVDGKADVYALGVMLYEMLSGSLPFRAEQSFDYMALHARSKAPSLLVQAPWVASEVALLVERMLKKRPVERPTMAMVAEELGRHSETDLSQRSWSDSGDALELPSWSKEVASAMTVSSPPVTAPRVMIVDDDVDLAETLELALTEVGYQCKTLDRDHERITMNTVRSFRPQVVLLDVELPGKSGYKLCWEIKSDPQLKDTVVVLVSGKSREVDRKLGLAMQADAYLTKPFVLAELLTVVQLLLDREGRSGSAPDHEARALDGKPG